MEQLLQNKEKIEAEIESYWKFVIEQVGDKLATVHSIERKMDAGAPSVKSMMDLRKIFTGKNMLVSQDSNA